MSKIQKKEITRQSVVSNDRKLFKDDQSLINSVLAKKFGKKNKKQTKDDCDSCGEQCFD